MVLIDPGSRPRFAIFLLLSSVALTCYDGTNFDKTGSIVSMIGCGLRVFFALALSCVVTWSAQAANNDRCVVLISVDGLANFYLDDPNAHLPTLRQLAKEGARAQGMVCSFPTVTWPNHTTLVTGVPPAKHGVLGNSVLDRRTGQKVPLIPDPLLDKDQIVKSPTIYDVAFNAGLKTGAICWPATRNARTLNWTVPDMFEANSWEEFGTKSWLAELRSEGIPVDSNSKWVRDQAGGVQRDWLYARMGVQLLTKHQPNLLLVHFVEADHVQHRYGPRTPDAYWSVSYEDDRVRDIKEAIERSPLKDKTTLIVCSDHGFFPIEKDIRPNVVLKKLGLIETEGNKVTNKRAICQSEGGGCSVYILDEAKRAEIREQLLAEFSKVEGIELAAGSEKKSLGQAVPKDDSFAADLWLAASSGYSFTESVEGEEPVVARSSKGGTHGYLPTHPEIYATFIAWGAGVTPGTDLGLISNQDVAPTIANILGVDFPSAEGKVLKLAKDE